MSRGCITSNRVWITLASALCVRRHSGHSRRTVRIKDSLLLKGRDVMNLGQSDVGTKAKEKNHGWVQVVDSVVRSTMAQICIAFYNAIQLQQPQAH